MQIIYLYGFASGPLSNKAQFFKHKFDLLGIPLDIFDFIPNRRHFQQMQPSKLVENLVQYVEENYPSEQVILFGSSFGGLIAAWYSALYPNMITKLILMAPALQFTPEFIAKTLGTTLQDWQEKDTVLVEHYRFNVKVPLNYSFVQDLQENSPPIFSPTQFPVPTVIFHGRNDAVVPIQWSIDFAFENPKVTLNILEGDHQLLDQKQIMWNSIQSFLSS